MKNKRYVRHTNVLIAFFALFLLGLGVTRLYMPISSELAVFSIPMLMLGVIASKRNINAFYLIFILSGLLFGWWRGSVVLQKLNNYQNFYYHDSVLEATVLEDGVYNDSGQLTFTATDIVTQEPSKSLLVGQIEISGLGSNMVYRGDRIKVDGKLFPKRGSNQAGVSFANISIISRDNSPINSLRRRFAVGMQNALPEPMASFALGLLIGQRNTLGKALSDELTTVGLIHIVAVSGYNLTVIINASQNIFGKRSRYQSLVFSLALIGTFLLLTGNSPSIIRAAIVSTISLIFLYFGRRVRPLLLLLLAAVITGGINPLYVWSNIGWYLSFTAFFGILILAPLLKKRFIGKKFQNKLLPSILTETISAQICTLPIILFIFGRLSVVSIIANLLVVPVIPLAMLLSLVAGISGALGLFITGLVALPARIILEYILSTANLLARVPHANVEYSINAIDMILMYILIIIFIMLLSIRTEKMRGTISQETKE